MAFRFRKFSGISECTALLCVMMICAVQRISAAENDSTYISFPGWRHSGIVTAAAGMSLTILPRAVVEEEIRQVPMIEGAVRWDLPWHLYATANISTIYIANQVSAGLWWSVRWKDFAFAIGNEVGFWYGTADMEGFNTASMGLLNYPSLCIGMALDDMHVTVRETALMSISQHTYVGDANIGRVKPSVTGIATTLILEQPIWKHHMIAAVFQIQYAQPQYQSWLAFTPVSRWMTFPEFSILYLW